MKSTPFLLCAGVLITSCGGGGEPAEDEPTETTDDTSGDEMVAADDPEVDVPSPPVAWEEMSHEDQAAWMNAEVLPRMRRMFQGYDADRFSSVTCGTCHGPGAAAGEFDMPSNSLPALPPTGSPEQEQMVRQYGPMLRFMYSHVTPTMQTLVGGEDYDEETREGFSCFACHPHQGDEGSTLISLEAPPAE